MSDELPPLGNELQQLLSDTRGELAPAAAKAKARAALGLPPPTGSAAPPPKPPPAAPAAASTAGVTATVIKGTVVVALLGAAFGVGVRVGDQRARDEFALLPPKTITVEVPVPVAAPVVDVPIAPAPTPAPTPSLTPPPLKPKVAKVEPDALQAELALLEVARARLEANDAEGALKSLAKYDATFPRGTMRTDARLTRLDALLLAGRTAEARKLGDQILAETDSELVRDLVRRRFLAR